MWWKILLGVCLILAVCFSSVLIVGAPYLPTLKAQIDAALKLANLKTGNTIIELGCGDGRVLVEAARQGLNAVGYELNPLLFLIAWVRTRKYGRQIRVIYGDFWHKTWPKADAVYVFLLPRLMGRLDEKIKREKLVKGRVVSFAFTFPDREPLAEKHGIFLYDFSR